MSRLNYGVPVGYFLYFVFFGRIAILFHFLTTVPFALRAIRKDVILGILSPILLAARSCAQLLGVTAGLMYARRNPALRP